MQRNDLVNIFHIGWERIRKENSLCSMLILENMMCILNTEPTLKRGIF